MGKLTAEVVAFVVGNRFGAVAPDAAISFDRKVLWTKFLDCIGKAMSEGESCALFETLQDLESPGEVRSLPTYGPQPSIH